MVWVICGLLAALAIGFTLWVRQRDIPPAPVENPELRHLQNRRQVLYENLKDLQFEYHQGKLSEQDYQSLKQGFLYDLAGVMDSIERLELKKAKSRSAGVSPASASSASDFEPKSAAGRTRPDKSQDRPEKDRPSAPQQVVACPSCKAPNPVGNRFCGHCGQPL